MRLGDRMEMVSTPSRPEEEAGRLASPDTAIRAPQISCYFVSHGLVSLYEIIQNAVVPEDHKLSCRRTWQVGPALRRSQGETLQHWLRETPCLGLKFTVYRMRPHEQYE